MLDLEAHTRRRWRKVTVEPSIWVDLLRGGVFQFRRSLPADATLARWLVDPDSFSLVLAVHSNTHGMVRLGDVVPEIQPLEIVEIMPRSLRLDGVTVRPTDQLFADEALLVDEAGEEGVVGWLCSRCQETREERPVVRQAPWVYRLCRRCAG